jgi:hypothetical protein
VTATLAAAFQRGNSRKTKWQGTTVHSVLRLQVSEGDVLRVSRQASSPARAQALKVATDRGELRANGIVVPVVAIWSHTAPAEAVVEVVGRRTRVVDLWNAWSFQGVDSAWLGNAGMLVESSGDSHLLRCSDGLGRVSFDDLVVHVRHERRE